MNKLKNNISFLKKKYCWNLFYFFSVILIFFSIGFSFYILLDLSSISPSKKIANYIIILHLILSFLIIIFILLKLYPIVKLHRKTSLSLHWQIISLFSVAITFPVLVVAITSTITLHLGLDRWFDKSTKEIINSSAKITNVYAEEVLQRLSNSAYMMSLILDNYSFLKSDKKKYKNLLNFQVKLYHLKAAFLITEDQKILMKTNLKDEDEIPILPKDMLEQAKKQKIFLFQPGNHDFFGVVVYLKSIPNAYLYILQDVNPMVLEAMRLTEINNNEYRILQEARSPIQFAFLILYICLFLNLWFCVIWIGIKISDKILDPIYRLIHAAGKVANGNFDVVLFLNKKKGDIAHLLKSFNSMVYELKNQHNALIEARDQVDQRRRFIETVLSGVTSGIIGVDHMERITIINSALEKMFFCSFENIYEKNLLAINPKVFEIFQKAKKLDRKYYCKQISLNIENNERIYIIKVIMEDSKLNEHSWLITIDDITDLIFAQRSSAWLDIARRIAHEIKNPLTPIQLSAERMKKRYRNAIIKEREIFDQCTDTIIRQVEDIGRMVDEFSSFARMPQANLRKINICSSLKEAIFLIEVSQQNIIFEQNLKQIFYANCDNRLLIQAFTNLIKNATESIKEQSKKSEEKGHILFNIASKKINHKIYAVIDIIDNGKGFPKYQRQKLLEPYVTTREKGTGLGLAIVHKIIEEHNGSLELLNAPINFYEGRGAMVRILLPLNFEKNTLTKI